MNGLGKRHVPEARQFASGSRLDRAAGHGNRRGRRGSRQAGGGAHEDAVAACRQERGDGSPGRSGVRRVERRPPALERPVADRLAQAGPDPEGDRPGHAGAHRRSPETDGKRVGQTDPCPDPRPAVHRQARRHVGGHRPSARCLAGRSPPLERPVADRLAQAGPRVTHPRPSILSQIARTGSPLPLTTKRVSGALRRVLTPRSPCARPLLRRDRPKKPAPPERIPWMSPTYFPKFSALLPAAGM